MRVVLFDSILEQHVCESLERALRARGHEVWWTGPLTTGHLTPGDSERERVSSALDGVAERAPDLLLNFRAGSLSAAQVRRLRELGTRTLVWFPDDPVLYERVYRHVVTAYDVALHAAGEEVLRFYEERHGTMGLGFPFWTDVVARPLVYDPARADVDFVFLGNTKGAVRARRYEILASLPFSLRVHGTVEADHAGLDGGRLEGSEAITAGLARAKFGISIPQRFTDYAETKYDFRELGGFGAFDLPSRVVQYAAAGLPTLQISDRARADVFPELITVRDPGEVRTRVGRLLADEEALHDLSARTHARFEKSFSATARALLIERIAANPELGGGLDAAGRACLFASVESPADQGARRVAPDTVRVRPSAADPRLDLRSIPEQRDSLRRTEFDSPVTWRILHFGAFSNGENDIVASLKRALVNVGHTVLHVDTKRTKENLAAGLVDYSSGARGGHAPSFVNLHAIERLVDRFKPQMIICNAGGLTFRPEEAQELKRRGILLLGVTLSDPDVFGTVSRYAGVFDFHTTNSTLALSMYKEAGIENTLLFPFGIDRDFVLADVPHAEDLRAEVICMGHASASGRRNETMGVLAEEFAVRVYGNGWKLPGAEVLSGDRQIQALRAGTFHVNFARTRSNHLNVKCGVFESVASGGVVCTARFPEMEQYFEYGTEIVGFEDPDELAGTIGRLLAEPERVERMRRAAFARLTRSHLYEHRWQELFRAIEDDLQDERIVTPSRAQALREGLRQRPPTRSVVISGFYGGRNSGDELLLRAITKGVEREREDIDFVVAAHNPREVVRVHGLAAFSRRDAAEVDRAAEQASAVILGGGGLWHDYTFERAGGLSGLFQGSTLSIPGLAVLPLLAAVRRRHVHVFGMGVGPLDSPDARALVRFVGAHANSISVRDATSRQILEGIDGWHTPVRVAPDPVFGLDLGEIRVPDVVREVRAGWPVLAVNLRPWAAAREQGMYERIAEALQAIVRKRDVALVGLPLQGGDTIDAQVLREVFDMVDVSQPKVVLDWTDDFAELFGVIQASDALVAMRLHASLLAHRLGTPAVGIHYDPKVRRHYEDVGEAELSLPIGAPPELVVDALDEVLSQDPMESRVRERVRELEAGARAEVAFLAAQLEAAPRVGGVEPFALQVP